MQNWLEWLLAALMAVLGFLGAHLFRKADALEREKATRAEIADLLKRMDKRDDEARESRKALHAKLDQTISSVGDVRERVARIEGEIGKGK